MSVCRLQRGVLALCLLWIGVFQPRSSEGSKQCEEKVADVVFLLDSSYSIWRHQFSTQLAFLSDLVQAFTIGPNNMRVGVVTFSTNVRLDVALNEHNSTRQLQAAIGQIQYMKGGTRTGDAIHFAHTRMFTGEYGSRPWAAHIVILITDGYSYNSSQTALEASIARSKGIQLFAIGVGSGVDETELRAIASDPDDSHVFHVENYGALKKIEKSLTEKTCHRPVSGETTTLSPTHQPGDSEDTATKRCGGKPADIYFLLDSSSSIWSVDFGVELQFVSQLLQLFDVGVERTRVGVAVYSDDVHNVVSLSDRQNVRSLQQALKNAPYLTGGTNTGKALHYVRTKGFAKARQEVAHVIIILTDGQSMNTTHTLQEAQRAHDQGIYVFSIGIGSSTDIQELMEIASDPDENFMFHVDNFGGLQNIRTLLAIKTCDVRLPNYQGDQGARPEHCRVTTATDIIFVYDAASVGRLENEAITGLISDVVHNVHADPHTVHYGLVRENHYKGDNIDLKAEADASVLQALLQKPIHHGLGSLLKRVRLHGYLAPRDPKRSRSRKVLVLFAGSKVADPGAVEKELKRLQFQGVGVMVVAWGSAEDHVEVWRRQSSVVVVDSYSSLASEGQRIFQAFCALVHTQG